MRRSVGLVLSAIVVAAGVHASSALAAFPGQNGKVAFTSSQFVGQSFTGGAWTIAPDGSGESLLIEDAYSAAWSADGSKLVYLRSLRSEQPSDVYTSNADGSGEQRLTNDAYRERHPAWSPDGSTIAWASERSGRFQIWTMKADGSDARQVTSVTEGKTALEPVWSPNGQSIAYTERSGGEGSVRIMSPDGSGDRAVTAPGFDGYSPDWAPDGSRLVFVGAEEQFGGALYTVQPDGSGQQRIPNLQGGLGGGADGMSIGGPVYSPDGTQVAYHYVVCLVGRCGYGIVLAAADGSEKHTLAAGVRFETFSGPDWQPLNRPPDCTGVTANPATPWGAKRRWLLVTLTGATDPDGDEVSLRVTGVTHDGRGGRGWRPGPQSHQVFLKAKPKRRGDGRLYTISFEVVDARGATCTGAATVTVPGKVRRHRSDD